MIKMHFEHIDQYECKFIMPLQIYYKECRKVANMPERKPNILKQLRRQLAVVICLAISCVAVVNIVAYYLAIQSSYLNQLNHYNDSIVEQAGKLYEQALRDTLNNANRAAIYDTALSHAVREGTDYDSRIAIRKALSSLTVTDDTIHSAYL